MIIDCVGDLHGHYPDLDGGDLLIVAGDLTARDTREDYEKFMAWLDPVSFIYQKVILIGGNHDNQLQEHGRAIAPTFCEYLFDSGCVFEYEENNEIKRLKIWGSPWSKTFDGINPHCMAFTKNTEYELSHKWQLIPEDVDILITHAPPYCMFDRNKNGHHCGSTSLMDRYEVIHPALHVFGHIHEQGGRQCSSRVRPDVNWTTFVNASHMNECYEPINKPIRIEL